MGHVFIRCMNTVSPVFDCTVRIGSRRFASCIGQFLRVVLITVHGQTVVIFTQLLLSKMRDVVVLAVGMHQVSLAPSHAPSLAPSIHPSLSLCANMYAYTRCWRAISPSVPSPHSSRSSRCSSKVSPPWPTSGSASRARCSPQV